MKAFSDSELAGYKDDRKGITGYYIYINFSWKSRVQKHVTLSSTELEYVVVSEVCTDIMFIKTILECMQVEMKKPVIVHCDNMGAIIMGYNAK